MHSCLMSPLYRMRIQYLLMTSPLPGNAPWTMKINTPKFNMCPTFVQRRPQRSLITMTTMTLRRPVVTAVTNQLDHIDGATTAQQKGGRAETKTYMNYSRRMTSVQIYHNATEKGRAQTKLTWTSILLIISLFSLYVKKCFTMLVFWTLFL